LWLMMLSPCPGDGPRDGVWRNSRTGRSRGISPAPQPTRAPPGPPTVSGVWVFAAPTHEAPGPEPRTKQPSKNNARRPTTRALLPAKLTPSPGPAPASAPALPTPRTTATCTCTHTHIPHPTSPDHLYSTLQHLAPAPCALNRTRTTLPNRESRVLITAKQLAGTGLGHWQWIIQGYN
jgi:hypothetical protein